MKQIPILSGKSMIVEMPDGATNPIVDDYLLGYNLPPPEWAAGWGDESYDTINLPPGTWRIIGMLSEVTEEQAKQIVDFFTTDDDFGNEDVFRDYLNKSFHDTALESLESAILAEGYTFTNPYGSTAPDAAIEGNGFDYLLWHESQSRVLCREGCLVLRRVD